MQILEIELDKIVPYEFNARRHDPLQVERIARSIKDFGWSQPIVVDDDGVILVGHGRLLAAQVLGLEKAPVVILSGLSEEKKKAYRILDNKLQNDSTWDFDTLGLELGFLEDQGFDLKTWGLDDLTSLIEREVEADEKYSRKIESPVYTPNGERPSEIELCDTDKYDSLLASISELSAPQAVKSFLSLAAARHIRFDYQKIAEYYAHAPAEVQRRMEESALVIIDFKRAIENGFVQLVKDLADSYTVDENEEQEHD